MSRPHVQLVTDDAVECILVQPLRVELTPAGPPAFTRGGEPVQPRYVDLVDLVEALTRELIGDVFGAPALCELLEQVKDEPLEDWDKL